jgi:hypothetical protein
MPPIFWTQKQDIGPSARTKLALAYDMARQRVVVFGGDPGGSPLGDTWAWDGNLWTQIADTGPSPRRGATLVDEVQRQRLVLFGGGSGPDILGDTWVCADAEWTQVADTGPSPRVAHAMAYDPYRQRTVLFGGQAAGLFGDTWEWDGNDWTQVEDVGPAPRAGHAMAFDVLGSRTVLFGGWGTGANFGDTWAWNGATWTQIADTGPDPRIDAGVVGGVLGILLFGGISSLDPAAASTDRLFYGDSWLLAGGQWSKVQDIGPVPRYGHAMANRTHAGRVSLFGGTTTFGVPESAALGPGLRRDTWEVQWGAAVQPGVNQPPLTGVEINSVGVQPNVASLPGDALGVYVFLGGPAPYDVVLDAAIFQDIGGSVQPVNPPGFTIPQPIVVQAGMQSTNFQIVRDTNPLVPGQYVMGVGIGGMVQATGTFQVT